VVYDSKGKDSALVAELLNNLRNQTGVEEAFRKTRDAVSRASEGEQIPSVSSSLAEDVRLAVGENGG
jgi:hypothetical protein